MTDEAKKPAPAGPYTPPASWDTACDEYKRRVAYRLERGLDVTGLVLPPGGDAMTDDQRKRIDEDDRRRFELVTAALARGASGHGAVWDAQQVLSELRSARERDEAEAQRLAELPERAWPVEALVAEIDRLRAEVGQKNELIDWYRGRVTELEAKAKAAKAAEVVTS